MKVLSGLLALLGILLATESDVAQQEPAPKSFAVFVTSYNSHNDTARGGVCGAVFFVSPTLAITAFHVLKASSFSPLPGFEHVRIWLVHENYPAVELKPEYISSNPDRDVTLINLPESAKVDRRFVFATSNAEPSAIVETDGFIANTTGPVLVRDGADLKISSVPYLTRLHLVGTVMQLQHVNINAKDINLKNSPSVELSYQPVVGISGGPVTANGKVIAMNSFADPGSFKHTWAMQFNKDMRLSTP